MTVISKNSTACFFVKMAVNNRRAVSARFRPFPVRVSSELHLAAMKQMSDTKTRDPGLENAYAYAALMQSNAKQVPSRRFIRRRQLREIVPLADTTIYEMEQRNEFPRRILIASRVVVWDLAEVEAWMDQRRQDSRTGAAKASGAPNVRKRKSRPVRRAR